MQRFCIYSCSLFTFASFFIGITYAESHTDDDNKFGTDGNKVFPPHKMESLGPPNGTNNSNGNDTHIKPKFTDGLADWISFNNGALLRTTYVLLGITLLIVLYFAIRTCR